MTALLNSAGTRLADAVMLLVLPSVHADGPRRRLVF
jgi:hypothetical protein